MSERTPALFERVPRGLFGPLGDPYAELYWELLAELYRHEFEREPFVVVRSTALDVAEAVIRASRLWSERRLDLEALALQDPPPREPHGLRGPMVRSAPSGPRSLPTSDPQATDEAAAIRALARRLVARLEDSGWMHFQYRAGVGEIMSFHAYAARTLQTLLDVARDEQPVFQGLVHSIAALLEPRAFAQRPGVSLLEARRHTLELSRELKILERNIHLFIQRVLDGAATAAEVVEEGFDRYEHAVMASYHRLKTVDNVYRRPPRFFSGSTPSNATTPRWKTPPSGTPLSAEPESRRDDWPSRPSWRRCARISTTFPSSSTISIREMRVFQAWHFARSAISCGRTAAPKASCSSLSTPWPRMKHPSWSSTRSNASCSGATSCIRRQSLGRGRRRSVWPTSRQRIANRFGRKPHAACGGSLPGGASRISSERCSTVAAPHP